MLALNLHWITMRKTSTRNPIIAAIALFLVGLGAVLMLRLRAEAESQSAQIVYIAPFSAIDSNLYLHDLADVSAQQLTHSDFGVEDFAISPDGFAIAYTRYDENGSTDIWLYDLRSGGDFPLTDCVQANCEQPTWRADGAPDRLHAYGFRWHPAHLDG